MSDSQFPTTVALFGAAGRMGQEILRQAWRFPHLQIAHGYDEEHVGETLFNLTVEAPPVSLPHQVRAVIDFSAPDAVMHFAELSLIREAAYVCGVTALSEATRKVLAQYADHIPVLYSPNMSPGMNVIFRIARELARALPEYERHIFEIHHMQKKDAPSGTALRLADHLKEGSGGETPITALRMGDVAGEHRVIFGGPGERIEVTHHADSRAVFAVGALRATEWLLNQEPGLYSMADVLGL
jgi:4-hydroxy-tetrahydrodipicolinate reductase